MILYLQTNYNSSYFSISEKNNYKNEVNDFDFIELETIKKDTTFKDLYNYLIKKYNCKKIILDI
jgi:hypothetical protein